MVDWQPYLKNIAKKYEQWWQIYTITDVEGKISPRQQQAMLLDLRVEEVKTDRENPREREPVSERLDILTGLRKYSLEASNHVLLQGKPGSGKSTALARLLLEESEKGLRIPVLIQLRYYKTSILDLIRQFLQEHGLVITDIESHLQQKQFFLLIDGINELPSDAATTDLKLFRKTYQTVPMVFTTRELGLRGDLDIEKKLAMQPLNDVQIKQFVKGYLRDNGENLLKQLGNERLQYIQHWETEINKLDAAMKTVGSANLQGIREDIDLYTAIRQKIAELTNILKNMNTLTPDIHRQSDFDAIINAVTEKLNADISPSPTTDSPIQPKIVQHFHGTVHGVAGYVQGNQQINSPTIEEDTEKTFYHLPPA
jgi:predicted NACHT family NTPase